MVCQGHCNRMKSSPVTFPESHNHKLARTLARRLIQDWQIQSNPSAARALKQYPFLFRYRSIAMDLAYEEYCLRSESGEQLDTGDFCHQFPDLLDSLQQRIAIHLLLTDGSTELVPGEKNRWPQSGERIMGYRVCQEIGRGCFARVYTAVEEELGNRLVVIKVCPHGADEADTLGRIEHPGIVPVHSVKQDPTGLTIICMPMLGTRTLCQVIQQDRGESPVENHRPCDRIVKWMLPLAEALDHAHGRGVLHLDLKPSNILITDDHRPMLLDFNLSFDSAHHSYRAGGTLPYMSPEQVYQLIMEPETELSLDHRSDIFSFGVILFEMLYGKLPWGRAPEHGSMREMATSLLEQQRALSHTTAPPAARKLQAVIQKCLQWDPDDRFQQMTEVVTELERLSRFTQRLAGTMDVHRRLLMVGALTLGTAGFLFGLQLSAGPSSGEKLIMQGQTAMNHGRHARAVTFFTHAMHHPDYSHEAQYRRGLAHGLDGEIRRALIDFQAVRKQIDDPRLDAMVGYSYQQLHHDREALDWYLVAVRNGLSNWQLWVNMAHVALNQNLHADAKQYLDLAEKAGANGAKYFYARLLCEYWKPGISQETFQHLAHWIQQLSNCTFTGPDAHADLARVLVRLSNQNPSRLPQAITSLETAICQGADLRELARDPHLRVLFRREPRLYRTKTGVQLSTVPCPEPIPVLYITIQIPGDELRTRGREKQKKGKLTHRKN